jgi:hypothetical protein
VGVEPYQAQLLTQLPDSVTDGRDGKRLRSTWRKSTRSAAQASALRTLAEVKQADRRDLSAVTAQFLKRSGSDSHRRRRRFVSGGHLGSLPNRCFTGGRFTPADAASSGHPRRGRFSTARSRAPSRLHRFGVQSGAPVQTSPLTPISATRIRNVCLAPEADRGYPVAHESTPAGHRTVAARRDAGSGPG